MEKPYDALGDHPVAYNGPPAADAPGPELKIGVFGPGAAKLAAALDAPGYRIVGVSSEAQWGKAADELVQLVYDSSLLGLVATDRDAAHLAEQIAAKTFIPVVAISNDRLLTSTNVPWIFRLDAGTPIEDAVRCLAAAVARAGPNRTKIRDYLASGAPVAGGYAFATNGERLR
jgi:hypothetical protein